jgi:hypothetical protein
MGRALRPATFAALGSGRAGVLVGGGFARGRDFVHLVLAERGTRMRRWTKADEAAGLR